MNKVLSALGLHGLVPVVVINDAAHADTLAEALLGGGLSCVEVTFRTTAAPAAIERIAKKFPQMLLGAGTVLSVDQVKQAVDLGARYIVSPGLSRKVVEYCLAHDIAVTPGVLTPTEIESALDLGLEVVKFFPAEAAGGLPYLKAIAAPYRKIKFIPTGGIDENNLVSYLTSPPVFACGGSWMVKPELIVGGKFDEIRALTAKAVNLMLGFELRHIGINTPDAVAATAAASQLQSLLGLPLADGSGSIFAGTQFEVMKRPAFGTHGHLAIGTNSIERAAAYLAARGVAVKPETRYEKEGRLHSIYLDIEVGGFAVHLLQK